MFNPDSRFRSAFTLLADVVILNMLIVCSSLPIVTGGAALRAANVVVGDMIQGIGSRYGLQYLREFRNQARPATAWWLVLLVAATVLVYQQWVLFQAGIDGAALFALQALALSGAMILAGISVWFFALESLPIDAHPSGLRASLSRAVVLAFKHLMHTLGALAVLWLAISLVRFLPLVWAVPAVFFFVPALCVYVIRLVLAAPLGQKLGE